MMVREGKEFQESVRQLTNLYEETKDNGEAWVESTEDLVRNISEEINRMLNYDVKAKVSFKDEKIANVPVIEMNDIPVLGIIDIPVIERSDTPAMEMNDSDVDDDSVISYLSADEEEQQKLSSFDIWKHIQESRKDVSKPSIKLTSKEWDDLSIRLNEYAQKQQQNRLHCQHAALKEELSECVFKPAINKRSKEMITVMPIQKRLDHILYQREQKIENERQRLAALEEATICEPKINKTTRWKPRVQRKYLECANDRLAQEEAELTFSPIINIRSSKLARKAKAKAQTKPNKIKPKQPSFQPKINSRSHMLSQNDDRSVYDRLYPAKPGDRPPQHVNTVIFDKQRHHFILQTIATLQEKHNNK